MQWRDIEPDKTTRHVSELCNRLSVLDLLRLKLACQDTPAVVLYGSCWEQIISHTRTSNKELGGLLLGRAYHEEHTIAAIEVRQSIASHDFDNSAVSLRMTPELWESARRAARIGDEVVGWYHSHPNLGAFFSGTDRRTQASFFRQQYNLGLVVDPYRGERAWFLGPNCLQIPDWRILEASNTFERFEQDSHHRFPAV